MKAQQIRRFDMLRRVQQFLDGSTALASVNATLARKELDDIIQGMAENEAAQATRTLNSRGETARQQVLRRDLVIHHMRPVAAIAAAHLRDVPGFHALLMPSARLKVASLVQAAMAMADVTREFEAVFVNNGRPADFVDGLLAAAAAVRDSIDTRAMDIVARAGARSGIKALGSRAHLVMRLLDAQVKSLLLDDPKALAAWTTARRIGQRRQAPGVLPIPVRETAPVRAA